MNLQNELRSFAFVMDAQHSSLFVYTAVLSVNNIRLPLPCPDSVWDASTPESWATMKQQTPLESLQLLPTLRSLLGKHPVPASCSAYSRFILLHGLYSIMFHLQAKDSSTLGVGTRRIISADLVTHRGLAGDHGPLSRRLAVLATFAVVVALLGCCQVSLSNGSHHNLHEYHRYPHCCWYCFVSWSALLTQR